MPLWISRYDEPLVFGDWFMSKSVNSHLAAVCINGRTCVISVAHMAGAVTGLKWISMYAEYAPFRV